MPLISRFCLVFVLLVAAPARADEARGSCISQHEHGQVARREGHFDSARESFSACTSDACPAPVRKRCGELLSELDTAQPTVVIAVHDAEGHDVLHGVSMTLDGGPARDVPATAVRIDPGEHVLGISAGVDPRRDHPIVVREGEKEKRVDIFLGQEPPRALHPMGPLASVGPPPSPPPSSPGSSAGTTGLPTSVRVWGGISVVALVGAGATSAAGWAVHAHLASSCSPSCSASQVAPLRVVWPVSFAALGVGVVSGVVAVTLFALHRTPDTSQTGLFVAPDGFGVRF